LTCCVKTDNTDVPSQMPLMCAHFSVSTL